MVRDRRRLKKYVKTLMNFSLLVVLNYMPKKYNMHLKQIFFVLK